MGRTHYLNLASLGQVVKEGTRTCGLCFAASNCVPEVLVQFGKTAPLLYTPAKFWLAYNSCVSELLEAVEGGRRREIQCHRDRQTGTEKVSIIALSPLKALNGSM